MTVPSIVVFDFDGTLVNSMGAFADIAARLIQQYHGWPFDRARRAYLDTSGVPFFQQLEILFPDHSDNPEIAARFEADKLEGFFHEPYFPDVAPAFTALRSMGCKLAVSSNNSQENVNEFVRRHGILFEYILGFRPGFEKGRHHFDHIIKKEEITPQQLLFVGDSLKDGDRAAQSGVRFVGRSGTFTQAQFQERFPDLSVVDSLAELPQLLGN